MRDLAAAMLEQRVAHDAIVHLHQRARRQITEAFDQSREALEIGHDQRQEAAVESAASP